MTISSPRSTEWPLAVGHGLALLQALERVGLDGSALMARSGVVLNASDLASSEPDEAVKPQLVKMVKDAVHLLEVTAAADAGDAPPHPYQYELMWFAAAGCRTVASAIGLIELYTDMVGARIGRFHSEHVIGATSLVLERVSSRRTPPMFLVDLLRILMADRMLSWLSGGVLPNVHYELAYPSSCSEYLPPGLVLRELRWDCVQSALCMPGSTRERRLVRSPTEVASLFPLAPVLLRERPDQSWAWRVARHIDESIADLSVIPSLDDVARVEFCSAATIRRRLESEGSTFQQIKNDRRRAWAIVLLQTKQHSVERVAEQLGFADEASFRRAFKQWTGFPPIAYARAN